MTDDLRRAIAGMGDRFTLSDYEIAAYLAVLDHGRLTASEIAGRTDVPQPRVYETVRSLADRGLVTVLDARPLQVVAVDPEEAFDGVHRSVDALVTDLSDRYTEPARAPEAVTLVRSRSTILRYLEEVIEAAEYELTVSLSPALLDRVGDRLRDARAAGVSVELLLAPAADAPDPATYDYAAVATAARTRRGITTPIVAAADGRYSIYTTQDALRSDADRYAVIFDRSALGFLVVGFFNTVLWTTAETLHEDVAAAAFPRRYASIRRCVKDLTALDGEWYAAVEGRDTDTGEPREVEGRVVDVTHDATGQVASFAVETVDGPVRVGGRAAALEAVEAHAITIDRYEPPE